MDVGKQIMDEEQKVVSVQRVLHDFLSPPSLVVPSHSSAERGAAAAAAPTSRWSEVGEEGRRRKFFQGVRLSLQAEPSGASDVNPLRIQAGAQGTLEDSEVTGHGVQGSGSAE